ncbi:MAG: DNA polymerase I [Thiotrichales bacterium]|jgi:DNA polymerase-1|nr:DNA polymerase I [Thiotrichales bacterium]MBT3614204.1 DNA polymerase I [Thiotrichales bacterium]MBT3752022.1 DNA polymerase I [Thiotrichales bacterium]MBT3837405.1 DNA polymerase I [Thiotrichales bacterium]MBT4152690.1 DNA polymerase I [Thiotrichales bacterium]
MTKTANESKISPDLILVDGSSYLFRAFHALPPLTNSKGQPTGAIYGVINMLTSLMDEYNPQQVGVIFDAKGKTFRNDLYPAYKANRPPMPDELRSQIEPLHQIIEALGYPIIIHLGVEADDVIGTLTKQAEAAGLSVLISTGDKDMAQLVTPAVTLINTMSRTKMGVEGVKEKFGVPPELIVDYLALIGDTSDNVPGVPKVGPKTAVKWLDKFGSLENILDRADEIGGKVGENLHDSLEQMPLSYELVTIKCDVDIGVEPTALKRVEADREKLIQLYAELEFKRWLEGLEGKVITDTHHSTNTHIETAEKIELNVDTIFTEEALDVWIEKLTDTELFAIDTETTSRLPMEAELVGISFAVAAGEAAYLPLAHQDFEAPQQLNREGALEKLRPLLEDPTALKVGQNLKYDATIFANHGIELRGIEYDTMLESYVIDSSATRHDMDSLALKYLGQKTISYAEVAGKGKKQLRFDEVPIQQAAPYAAEDAEVTLRLHQTLWQKLKSGTDGEVYKREKLFREVEMPLLEVLGRMERNGVALNAQMLQQQSQVLAVKIAEIEKEAFTEVGEPFNLASPKQIQAILYEQQGLPVLKKTPKGQPSTAESVLQELAEEYTLPQLILAYRSMSKLKSTYTDKLPKQINPRTGRVHTSYHQAVAVTGRLSSSDPNLQNIPIRSEEGRKIRQAFIAEEGNILVAADYSQIELRIMAHLSEDEGLVAAFIEGRDVHSATAAEVFGVALDEVDREQRRRAKAINFGLIYGMSAFGLAKQLGISRGAAQGYIEIYFDRYPGVKRYMDETREQAKTDGFVETLFGRRLYLPEINSRNGQRRQYAERTAINAPMQGTAADIIKRAMISVDSALQEGDFEAKMVMQVHDELVFEVAKGREDALTQMVREQMECAAELSVPLIVDVGKGKNWDEAH